MKSAILEHFWYERKIPNHRIKHLYLFLFDHWKLTLHYRGNLTYESKFFQGIAEHNYLKYRFIKRSPCTGFEPSTLIILTTCAIHHYRMQGKFAISSNSQYKIRIYQYSEGEVANSQFSRNSETAEFLFPSFSNFEFSNVFYTEVQKLVKMHLERTRKLTPRFSNSEFLFSFIPKYENSESEKTIKMLASLTTRIYYPEFSYLPSIYPNSKTRS